MLKATWIKTDWRKGRGPSNPNYPKGVELDVSKDANRTCTIDLTYPAPCIGYHLVTCERCGLKAGITAAGRTDDPRSIRVACKERKEH